MTRNASSPSLSAKEISSAIQSMQNIDDKMQSFTVVKRNGQLVPFRKERISQALEAAFRDTKKIGKAGELSKEISDTMIK